MRFQGKKIYHHLSSLYIIYISYIYSLWMLFKKLRRCCHMTKLARLYSVCEAFCQPCITTASRESTHHLLTSILVPAPSTTSTTITTQQHGFSRFVPVLQKWHPTPPPTMTTTTSPLSNPTTTAPPAPPRRSHHPLPPLPSSTTTSSHLPSTTARQPPSHPRRPSPLSSDPPALPLLTPPTTMTSSPFRAPAPRSRPTNITASCYTCSRR